MYVHSILHHWACILISDGHFIEYNCWWKFICELSKIIFFICIHFVTSFLWEWNEWPSSRVFGLLSFPSLHSLLMWLHSMFDLSWSSLFLRIFIVLLSSSSLLLIYPLRFTLLFFSYTNLFQVWYFPCIILTHLIISFCFIVSLLIFYSHWAPSGPWLTSSSIHVAFYTRGHWFFIIWYLGLIFLHFYYHMTLAYITSHVLRQSWGHGIRCHLRQSLLGQVFEIWLIFEYHHASSSGRCLCDVWTRFSCGYG